MRNQEGNVDHLIKKHLEKMSKKEGLTLQNCPSEVELSDYLENRLAQEKENSLLKHIADCPHCLSLLDLAKRAKERIEEKPSFEMLRRAKSIAGKNNKKVILNYRWLIFTLSSFILSFIFPRYFLQFLILAVIFGLKWIFDTGSTRTLIMIYESWRKKDAGTAQRIIQDFQDKTGQRK